MVKQNLHWHGMDNDIKTMISSCQLCQRYQKSQPQESLVERDMPSDVWDSLHSDVFEVEGVKYVLVIDEFSKFPFVKRLKGETSRELIEYLEELFGCYGKPSYLYSDNGGNYTDVQGFHGPMGGKTHYFESKIPTVQRRGRESCGPYQTNYGEVVLQQGIQYHGTRHDKVVQGHGKPE